MNRWQLRHAAGIVRAGGVIAYPTEYCFGLGCDPLNQSAVRQLLGLKQRSYRKGLILIASAYWQVEPYICDSAMAQAQLATVKASWPGPYTWIMPAADEVPDWLTGTHSGIALRVSAHPQVVALCDLLGGALVSTSANLQGSSPARTLRSVRQQFGTALDGYLPGQLGDATAPTQIRDAMSSQLLRSA